MKDMKVLFKSLNEKRELCFYIESSSPLTDSEVMRLKQILADGFIPKSVVEHSLLPSFHNIVELGPRMNFATPYSTNLVSICHACGLTTITRIEKSRRYCLSNDVDEKQFMGANHDRMTECQYLGRLTTFESGIKPEKVFSIPLIEEGSDALLKIPGLAMDEWDRNFYYNHFALEEKRNPTIVELQDLNNANSEHSRHGYFKGKQVINGMAMDKTLFEIVQSTWEANPNNSVIAFSDNSSAIKGFNCCTIGPLSPGNVSTFVEKKCFYNIIFTAETHNFPSGIAPVPGAETGTGGRIRDVQATGKGGLVIAGTAGYCVSNLYLPGYNLPWEDKRLEIPSNLATGLKIEIGASNGASDYGNKFGEPVINGFTRSYDLQLPGERWAFIKPIMFTGGIGQMEDQHTNKEDPGVEMLIVQVGGPAYRIGVGGGSASSMIQGENDAKLDFNAVQRGDAEMEQKMNRVVRACVEMGSNNPIQSIHDQGAGGPANVLKELVEKTGGKIELRRINSGDNSLSVLEIWIAEYQERCGFLINPDKINFFQEICNREKVNCEVLGKVTNDGYFVVHDEIDDSIPVNLNLQKVLGGMPQKTFEDDFLFINNFSPLSLPDDLTVETALKLIFKNIAVGSKGFLVRKVDRSVTGLIAQNQCCGPLHLPVSNVAVVAQSHFDSKGAATAIGEQPIKMILNPAAGARLAVTESLTNLVWAKITKLEDVKCSANWMWASKLLGEGAAIYDAALSMSDMMIKLGIAVDGGKDSLSMATKVGSETVKSPRELVISVYAPMEDITKVITPNFKMPGKSTLLYIDLSPGKFRLGASALAQGFSQIGDEVPDLLDVQLLKRSFLAIQELIEKDLILAGHDVSDGGLITTISEMAMSGNSGVWIRLDNKENPINVLFSEEPGLVMEVNNEVLRYVKSLLHSHNVDSVAIGQTVNDSLVEIYFGSKNVLSVELNVLRNWWESTSDQLEKQQVNLTCAAEEVEGRKNEKAPSYKVPFIPKASPEDWEESRSKYPVAILREEGSNGDREMTSAFYTAGFEPWDITMSDLLSGKANLSDFRGLVAVGGFSYADVPESAKGWASTIKFNEKLSIMFQDFYNRPDTFSLGVCNGCQLLALLGWVPWTGIDVEYQPRFVQNDSERFESRWSMVAINESPSIMLRNMEGSKLGVWVAHGEGKLTFPEKDVYDKVVDLGLAPIKYIDGNVPTMKYPHNPNGSLGGIAALCSPNGRHLAMMPHPERAFLKWQWGWLPNELDQKWEVSPWLKMFQNARDWCEHGE